MIDFIRILKKINVKYEFIASLLYLKKLSNESISPEDFQKMCPDTSRDAFEEVLRALEKTGIVKKYSNDTYRVEKDPFSIYPHIRLLEDIIPEDRLNRVELVYSIPEDLKPSGMDLSILKSTLPWEYIRLIRDSRKYLKIINPFFSEDTSRILETILPGKTGEGVMVEIFTRDTMDPDGNHEYLARLVKSIVKEGMPRYFRIFEFSEKYGFLHAKVLIRDGICAYIGSANLTATSFKKSLEIGVMVEGNIVEELERFINSLKRRAFTAVPLSCFQIR